MRFLLTTLAFVCFLLVFPNTSLTTPTPAAFETCSCAAADGSCNVTGSCPRGCLAYCPSNNCRVTCIGNSYEWKSSAGASVTLRMQNVSNLRMATELTRLLGAEVIITPRRSNATFSINVKNEPLWNVLDALSSEADIQIAHEDYAHLRNVRQTLLGGGRIAVCVHNVSAKRLAADLASLTGRDVYVASGDPETMVNYRGKAVTFEAMVAEMSQAAGVNMVIR